MNFYDYELEIITGPMFSGKTSLLIKRYKELKNNHNCLVINYIHDNRFNEGLNKLRSHDGDEIECISLYSLRELTENSEYLNRLHEVEYIFINEAQFFVDLKDMVLFILKTLYKNVVLCGLDFDYKREKFGEIIDLYSEATSIHQLTGGCFYCINPSIYSYRTSNSNKKVLIGGNNEYIPVCGQCYKRQEYIDNHQNKDKYKCKEIINKNI
tara:strand:- start:284 stop:916 length:633 start_codon:yes stop_codon:yes gene_type:complete